MAVGNIPSQSPNNSVTKCKCAVCRRRVGQCSCHCSLLDGVVEMTSLQGWHPCVTPYDCQLHYVEYLLSHTRMVPPCYSTLPQRGTPW